MRLVFKALFVLWRGLICLPLMIVFGPLMWLRNRMQRPDGIPTKGDMVKLLALVKLGDQSATRRWLRGAAYWEAIDNRKLTPGEAEQIATETGDGFDSGEIVVSMTEVNRA
jgi:hypothetical protein